MKHPFINLLLVVVVVFYLGVNICRHGYLPKRVEKEPAVKASALALKDESFSLTLSESLGAGELKDHRHSLAFYESLGFFDDIPQDDWRRYKHWSLQQADHNLAENSESTYGSSRIWYANNFFPYFNCPHAKRIGGLGDGAKWVCDPHRLVNVAQRREANGKPGPHCIIYSVGSNGNYDFEDGIINEVGTICEIHVFDFSYNYERPQNKEKNIHFHQWGLRASSERRPWKGVFYTFPEILKLLGHEGKTIDIFKIDCEGCEWATRPDWMNQDIRQVLIETHGAPRSYSDGLAYFQSYQHNQFAMFYKEHNGYSFWKTCYEFSYVKLHSQFWDPDSDVVQ
jgi:Methyltransferase domain